ncbi:MAG: toxin-antitoxin system YwqK family antitoxin [Humibacter sp.]
MTIDHGIEAEPTGQKPEVTPNARDDRGRKQGLWTDPDPHGGVMTGTYTDDLRQGEWHHYSSDGRLRSQGSFLDGELDGEWIWYRSNGRVMQHGGFRRGAKHGVWERWNAAGEPIDRGSYDDDRKVGEWIAFNPDGSVRRTTRHPASGA